jgi:hypothetical protein
VSKLAVEEEGTRTLSLLIISSSLSTSFAPFFARGLRSFFSPSFAFEAFCFPFAFAGPFPSSSSSVSALRFFPFFFTGVASMSTDISLSLLAAFSSSSSAFAAALFDAAGVRDEPAGTAEVLSSSSLSTAALLTFFRRFDDGLPDASFA